MYITTYYTECTCTCTCTLLMCYSNIYRIHITDASSTEPAVEVWYANVDDTLLNG